MKLTVTNISPLPLYRQMYDQLAAQILRGGDAPGEVLPPIRTVAQGTLGKVLFRCGAPGKNWSGTAPITAVGRGTFTAALGDGQSGHTPRHFKKKLTDAAQFCAAVAHPERKRRRCCVSL